MREQAHAGENPYQTPNSWVSLSLSTLWVLFGWGCVCVFFRMSVSSPPCSPALTLFYCMERFHREPLPFSQAVLGQYQCCAPELGRGQKLALVLGILLLLCCGQALPSDSSLATGAGDRCHLAKSLPRNLRGPTLVVEVSHQCGRPLAETLPSRCCCDDAPCSLSSQPGAGSLSYHPWECWTQDGWTEETWKRIYKHSVL